MPTVLIDQQSIFYQDHGPRANQPAVVLIHGAGNSHLDWPTPSRDLPSHRVIVPDLPGHGRSAPPGRTTIDAYAASINTLVKQLDLKEVVIGGHSMGGAIAQQIGLNRPAWLRGLILIGTGPVMKVTPAILDHIFDDDRLVSVADFITRYAWSRGANPILKGVGRKRILENAPVVLHGDYSACNAFDLRAELDQIDVPTLVIAGEKDKFMPLKVSQLLASTIPQAELVVLPATGHMIQLEQPTAVCRAMAAFLNSLSTP